MAAIGFTDRPVPALLVCAACIAVALPRSTTAHAQTDPPILQGVFWTETDPMIKEEGTTYPLTQEEIVRRLLEQARYTFSGMIYGFSFVYTPSDAARRVAELFVLEPIAEIPWGDPGLQVADVYYKDNREYAIIRYHTAERHMPRVRSWRTRTLAAATAYGTGDVFGGPEEKRAAVTEGVKEAIRAYYRGRIPNKPKEIRGDVAFRAVPYIVIDAGMYTAKVSITIREREVVPYRLY